VTGRFDGVTFVSDAVRERCARTIALIEDAMTSSHGPLRLDRLTKMDPEIEPERGAAISPVVIKASRRQSTPFRFVATRRGRVLRRYRTIDGALLHYPSAQLSEDAIAYAGRRR
jgi:hypothetical protein